MAFFLVLGGIFIVLGVLSIFFWVLSAAIVCIVFGALLASLPQFVIFSKYWLSGEVLRYSKLGVPCKCPVEEIGAAVICVYDEYRRGKGFTPVTFALKDGMATVPALCLFRKVDEDEIDLCDVRTAARLTFRKEHITDMFMDFDFLKEFWNSGFSGKVFIAESIYSMYQPAFERIFGGDERIVVYDRIPKKMKNFMR